MFVKKIYDKIKTKIKEKLREIRRETILKFNRFRIAVTLKKEGKIYKLVLLEKYKVLVNNTSRTILVSSIILSFIALPAPYSTIVSLVLIAIEQIIERVIYSFVTIGVLPFPTMEVWKKANFRAMFFEAEMYHRTTPKIGMLFEDEKATREVFNNIYAWNYGSYVDLGEENICLSFVIDIKNDCYAFFCYPSKNRSTYLRSANEVKAKVQGGEEHIALVAQMVMCKLFKYSNSGFKMFQEYYRNGEEYMFFPVIGDPNNPVKLENIEPITKNRIKVIHRKDLTNHDMEKFMSEYSINWEDKEVIPESIHKFGISPFL